MISKILVANRGEIACRVIKTAKKMGLKTVAVYSSADANAMHVAMADEAVFIGQPPSSESYLRGEVIIEKAKLLGVDAIHPGYGFLSENADFAQLCAQNNIIFIGPPPSAITSMGSKSTAKKIMEEANVPLVPGYHGDNQNINFLREQAEKIGYPVLLKAAAGGGGKGMRVVNDGSEFEDGLAAAKREAMKSFGDDHMLIEKYLTQPRHVEIQVFCDNHGNAVYLFERDCSVQRRHQKIIEEAPAPDFSQLTRERMGETAIKAALAIGYQGAGTVEFLYDRDESFYFMEMNTRLQVEHPVTEFITGLDLVNWQINVANGKPLPKTQDELSFSGHAVEARIYAEDPKNEFLPSTGKLDLLLTPSLVDENLRVDTGVKQGDDISVYYDPMIAKLIAYGDDRETALLKLENALQQYCIGPIKTNINYLLKVVRSSAFKNAELTTNFVEQHENELSSSVAVTEAEKIAAFVLSFIKHDNAPYSIFNLTRNFRLNHTYQKSEVLKAGETEIQAQICWAGSEALLLNINDTDYHVSFCTSGNKLSFTVNDITLNYAFHLHDDCIDIYGQNGLVTFSIISPDLGDDEQAEHADDIVAPMNGVIVDVLVSPDEAVSKGQTLVIIEAMKMEQSIKSPRDGVVETCFYAAGDRIDGGASLVALTKE